MEYHEGIARPFSEANNLFTAVGVKDATNMSGADFFMHIGA